MGNYVRRLRGCWLSPAVPRNCEQVSSTLNPPCKTTQKRVVSSVLEIDNWTFFMLDRVQLQGQKTINLNKLRTKVRQGEAVQVGYDEIGNALMKLARQRCNL